MNAGTLIQAPIASRYKANPAAGPRERQDDTVNFMGMFAQNLKNVRKTGTKAVDRKRDGVAGSKAQEMGDTSRNQALVDQGKKSESSEPAEDGTCQDDSKKTESGIENADKDSDSRKRCNEDAAEEAINLQAMSLLMQEMPIPAQVGETQDKQATQNAAMPTEYILELGGTEQTFLSNTTLADHEQMAAFQAQGLVQPPYAEAAREQTAQETTTRSAAGWEPSGRTSDTIRPIRSDTMGADITTVVQGHRRTQQFGEDTFFNADSRQNKTLNQSREQTETAGERPKDANRILKELKRNADAREIDLTGKAMQDRMNYGLRPVSDAREQQIDTPVLERLKTGVERATQTGNRELIIHLEPEGLRNIVIRLTNSGDKTTARIGVTNPETEKLVISQMESFKDMLRSLNTEVQEVYHSSQNAMDFSGFNQHMQKRRGQQSHTGYSFHTAEDSGSEEELLMEAKRTIAESCISRLCAYI